MTSGEKNNLLIASITPQNLERGVLWFSENEQNITRARQENPWWREHTIILEKDLLIKPSVLARRIFELGYERAGTVRGPGLFAVRGNIIEIWPINKEKPYLIEFFGNTIAQIMERLVEATSTLPKIKPSQKIENLPQGSFVVHEDHGIGILRGNVEQNGTAFFVVEYAPPEPGREPDKLYVPYDKKERLTPYIGFETPKIHRLGGSVWQTTKRKAKEDAVKLAEELLELYKKRSMTERTPHEGDASLENQLRESFLFQETEDQLRAEEEIMRDLASKHPMDRVLCGDVGFGKTELAIRATLRVILSGKQVVLLSPTTILASQHKETFEERFRELPIRTALLSRLTSQKEIKDLLEKIRTGVIDCVIGTHRLLSRDVVFKNLGLIIIDEEQRFGVNQKEHFTALRSEVDILSLSATPIPRTLSLALAKLRAISLISSPPPNRLPIRTYVLPLSKKLIRDAISEELSREGQIYVLHNRIETLERAKIRFEKIAREAVQVLPHKKNPRIAMIHGRMKEQETVRIMHDFRNHNIDILVATTIIENGLDISRANTLIVEDSSALGLAQAHQLRGRIGRSEKQAYAYFLYRVRTLAPKALERLEALQEYSNLGAGYDLALRDLEIRGAGNILGREQSGAINKVGLNLYYQMLNEAIGDANKNSEIY